MNQQVRGPAIFVRAEPPKATDQFCLVGEETKTSVNQDSTPWTIELGVEEIKETLAFYRMGNSFQSVDNPRAYKRIMQKVPAFMK